jgi:hypothetical protein
MAQQVNPMLFSLFTQCILYGIYIGTLGSCFRWLVYEDEGWKLRKEVTWPILLVTLFVCTCLTAYLSFSLQITLGAMFNRPHSHILVCMLVCTLG